MATLQTIKSKLKILYGLVLTLASLYAMLGCMGSQPLNEDSFANLTSSDLAKYKTAATNGDVHACTRLANYYLYIKDDKKAATQWLRVAAKARYPIAEHNLGVLLSSSENPEEIKESKLWLKKATAAGISY